jgi:hypothetical protein
MGKQVLPVRTRRCGLLAKCHGDFGIWLRPAVTPTGGTVHPDQIRLVSQPATHRDSRSIALPGRGQMIEAPVLHVNGDDPVVREAAQ